MFHFANWLALWGKNDSCKYFLVFRGQRTIPILNKFQVGACIERFPILNFFIKEVPTAGNSFWQYLSVRCTLDQQLLIINALILIVVASFIWLWRLIYQKIEQYPPGTISWFGLKIGQRLTIPLLAILLTWIASGLAHFFAWPRYWIYQVEILLIAWFCVRIITTSIYLFHFKNSSKKLAIFLIGFIWLFAILEIFQLFNPVISRAHNVAFSLGSIRTSLLNLIKGDFWLMLFLVVRRSAS